MHAWQKFSRSSPRANAARWLRQVMDVPILLQPPVTLPCIGDDRRPRLDVIHHEGVKRSGGIRQGAPFDSAESLRL